MIKWKTKTYLYELVCTIRREGSGGGGAGPLGRRTVRRAVVDGDARTAGLGVRRRVAATGGKLRRRSSASTVGADGGTTECGVVDGSGEASSTSSSSPNGLSDES